MTRVARGRLRAWWTRPGRTPWWLRAGVALVLATVALFGIVTPGSPAAGTTAAGTTAAGTTAAGTTAAGTTAAAGGPPSTAADAPLKSPEGPGAGGRVTRFPDSRALRGEGMSIYDDGCSSCHGTLLQGRRGMGPALYGVGAGPVDFYVSSGRMPLQDPTDEPERAHPAYTRHQIDAIIAYVTAVGGGPPAPAADPAAGSLALGQQVFTEDCAGCHQIAARGGMTVGAWVPNLQHADARQIAEAVRMGPYLMPHFDARQIDQHQLDSLVRYVLYTRHPDDAGGWGIDNIGPIPEGMAAWFIALLAMVIVARLIGERTGREIP